MNTANNLPETRKARITTSPGRLGPVGVVKPATLDGKHSVARMLDGTTYVLFDDGSFRNVYPRRPAGLSGRQRRIIRKEETRRARRVAAAMRKVSTETPQTPNT